MKSRALPTLPATLPCSSGPCPHHAACCSWGTLLTEGEAAELRQRYGADKIRWVEDEWRTAVVGGRCVFLLPSEACSIHEEPFYPVICRGFPWRNGQTGGPYTWDLTICPELAAAAVA